MLVGPHTTFRNSTWSEELVTVNSQSDDTLTCGIHKIKILDVVYSHTDNCKSRRTRRINKPVYPFCNRTRLESICDNYLYEPAWETGDITEYRYYQVNETTGLWKLLDD